LSTSAANAAATFHQTQDAQLVGLAVAGGVRRHVGQHHVGAAADHLQQLGWRILGQKIELREADARYLRHFQQIDRDHLALAIGRADALGRDLAPAAGRGAEVDHREAGS